MARTDTTYVLATNPPPPARKHHFNVRESLKMLREITKLEVEFGIPHEKTGLNPVAITDRLAEVNKQVADVATATASAIAARAAAVSAPAPAAAAVPPSAPASVATAPIARAFVSSGDQLTDNAMLAAGCHSLAQYKAAAHLNQLIDAAAGTSGLTRKGLDLKIAAAKVNLQNLS